MYNVLYWGWGFVFIVLDMEVNLLVVNFFFYSYGKVVSFVLVVLLKGREVGVLEYLFNGLIC